jgi:hypothetical protein
LGGDYWPALGGVPAFSFLVSLRGLVRIQGAIGLLLGLVAKRKVPRGCCGRWRMRLIG